MFDYSGQRQAIVLNDTSHISDQEKKRTSNWGAIGWNWVKDGVDSYKTYQDKFLLRDGCEKGITLQRLGSEKLI